MRGTPPERAGAGLECEVGDFAAGFLAADEPVDFDADELPEDDPELAEDFLAAGFAAALAGAFTAGLAAVFAAVLGATTGAGLNRSPHVFR